MLTPTQKTLILIVGLLLAACSSKHNDADSAMEKARQKGLLEVQQAGVGLPYFSPHTLDPIWISPTPQTVVTIPNLNLIDTNGKKYNEELFDGKTTVVTFFFSSCMGFCPTLLKNVQKAQQQLKGFKDVQYIALSVDPERDTPQRLKAYLKQLNLDSNTWKLFTGDKKQIWDLARETFSAETFALPVSKGQIAHSEHCYIIDSERRLRGVANATRLDLPQRLEPVLIALRK